MDAELQTLIRRAEELARAGNFTSQALGCNQEILKRDPENLAALQRLVTIHANGKQWRQVFQYCRVILSLDPRNSFAQKRLKALKQGKSQTIFTGQSPHSLSLQDQLEHTEDPDHLHRLGKQWQEAGIASKAVQAFQKALERDPKRTKSRLALAGTWRDLQCFGEAESAYEGILAECQDPSVQIAAKIGLAAVLADRAVVYQQSHLLSQAESLCREVLKISPECREALNTLNRIRAEMQHL